MDWFCVCVPLRLTGMLNKQTLSGGRNHRICSQGHPFLVGLLLWLSPQFIILYFLTFWVSQNQDFKQLNVAWNTTSNQGTFCGSEGDSQYGYVYLPGRSDLCGGAWVSDRTHTLPLSPVSGWGQLCCLTFLYSFLVNRAKVLWVYSPLLCEPLE